MSFDLRPKNKDLEEWSWGAFTWPVILQSGIGLPVGYAEGFRTGSFIYEPDSEGLCVAYNDGARVTSKQAQQMAQIARWIIRSQRTLRTMWDGLPESERQMLEKSQYTKVPYGLAYIDRLEAFADWLEKSKGFRVY